MQQVTFTKNENYLNLLFDEFFSEYCTITIIAYNYDGQGSALCKCDGKLAEIDIAALKKIIFGVSKDDIEEYLRSLFDPDLTPTSLTEKDGQPVFRLPELQKVKKYDLLNLAKATFKKFADYPKETFHYFNKTTRVDNNKCASAQTTVYGNTKSNVFHKSTCKSFNSITCTALFNSHSEAINAGFKACRICKP